MPSPISIRERIVRQWKANVATITDVTIGTVYRWDARVDQTHYQPSDIWITVDSIDYEQEEQVAVVNQTITLRVAAYVPVPDDGTLATASIADRWMSAIEKILFSDRTTVETNTAKKLSYDMRLDSAEVAELQDGVTHVAVSAKVFFRTIRSSPYESGTVTEVTE